MGDQANVKCKLTDLMNKTGYFIKQQNGQRKFGPPPEWVGPPPPRGCEVFIGKLPREIFEDELVPLFSRAGKIYELRLMMDFSGSNRGYAFVTYTTPAEASTAIRTLNGFEIRPRRNIGVVKSVDNCRLFFGDIPSNKSKEEIRVELSKYVSGITNVILYQNCYNRNLNRGFAFVEFSTHKEAAMARRALVPGCIKLWDREVIVDWAEPEPDIGDEQMKNVKVLYARNFEIGTTPETIKRVFESVIDGKLERVKKIYDYAFIHFYKREHAELAMAKLQYYEIDGSNIEIRWAKPVDRDLYKIQKMTKGNAKFNNSLHLTRSLLHKQQMQMQMKENGKCVNGHGSGCLWESPCCSPDYKICQSSPPHQEYQSAPTKLELMCRRYKWSLPMYNYQKCIDPTGIELWVCSIELPQVGQPLLSMPRSVGPICTRPCYQYQQAQIEAAEIALKILQTLQVEVAPPSTTLPPVYSPQLQPLPNCLRMPYDYTYAQTQPVIPVTLPTVWRPM